MGQRRDKKRVLERVQHDEAGLKDRGGAGKGRRGCEGDGGE